MRFITLNKWEDFLTKIKEIKQNYEPGEVKIMVPPMITLIMSGAFDDCFDKPLVISQRFEAIERLKKACKSSAGFPKIKEQKISMEKISSDFDRQLWLADFNPIFSIDFCNIYQSAIQQLGFKKTKEEFSDFFPFARQFTIDQTGRKVEDRVAIAKNYKGTISEFSIKTNFWRKAFFGYFNGYVTKKYDGREFIEIHIFDGTEDVKVRMWPKDRLVDDLTTGLKRKVFEYDPKINKKLGTYRHKLCLFIGKVSVSGVTKKPYFSLQDIIDFSI